MALTLGGCSLPSSKDAVDKPDAGLDKDGNVIFESAELEKLILKENIDANHDGKLSKAEMESLTKLEPVDKHNPWVKLDDIEMSNISSLKGLEYAINLESLALVETPDIRSITAFGVKLTQQLVVIRKPNSRFKTACRFTLPHPLGFRLQPNCRHITAFGVKLTRPLVFIRKPNIQSKWTFRIKLT
jgi:hypothetical protein